MLPVDREFLKGASLLLGERGLRILVGVVVQLVLARYLGPIEYGNLGYVLKIVGLFMTIVVMGLDEVWIREFSLCVNRGNLIEAVGGVVIFRLIVGLFCYLALAIFGFWFHGYEGEVFWMLLLLGLTLFSYPFQTVEQAFHAQGNFSAPVGVRNRASLLFGGL
ncbi:MAG: hypothetical protein N2578_07405, partial [Bdellovibrionaceae bacterium]|nr:hypothetical protein [Pseudobdellovibrionaceae bacterium]